MHEFTDLVTCGHGFKFFAQSTPVIRLKLRVLDSFLAPVLVQASDLVLARLEIQELITHALFN